MKRMFIWLIALMLLGSVVAYAANEYTNSAHGNSVAGETVGYGVNRSSASQYEEGHCAHCHEQHASIDGGTPADPVPNTGDAAGPDGFCLLALNFDTTPSTPYDQDDNACFFCHTSSASGISLQTNVVDNNNYAATFGGATAVTTGIFQAFKSTSYHDLDNVYDYITNSSYTKTFDDFPANSNPCSGCHNVHIAKRSCGKPGATYDPTKSAISKPSVHDSLWGDDTTPTNERMTFYGTDYQPPYDADDTNLEPDGAGTDRAAQALKTPDYNAFCLDCHQNEVPSSRESMNPSTTSGYLTAIVWSSEKHGTADADDDIRVELPYTAGTGVGYVLSCLDCHEPHGSPNDFLLRNSVNGETLSGTVSTGLSDYGYLCTRCHIDDDDTGHAYGVANRWESVHHCATDYPYYQSSCSGADCHPGGGKKIVCGSKTSDPPVAHICSDCHYHGSSKSVAIAPNTRVTF